MRSLLAVILVLLTGECAVAQNRYAIGTDLTGIIRTRAVNISAGCGFTENWSVSWASTIDISPFRNGMSPEEEEHRTEFSPSQTDTKITGSHSISVQYWMHTAFTGTYLTGGIRHINNGKTDYTIGAGYCIPVWKGFRMNISYETDILSSLQDEGPSGRGLHIGICWML